MLPAPIDSPMDFGVPGLTNPSAARSRAPCTAGAAPHRRFPCGLPPRCPRGLGQGSNAAAAQVSPSGQTVDSCGGEIVGRFLFSELPYNVVIFLINKNTPTFEVITMSHHAFLLPTSEAPAPFSFLFVFCRKKSEIVSSTSLHFFHCPEGLAPSWAHEHDQPRTRCKPTNPSASQGAATVRLLRVSLTSKASAKACSWGSGRNSWHQGNILRDLTLSEIAWISFSFVFFPPIATWKILKSKTMQNIVYHEIQKTLEIADT